MNANPGPLEHASDQFALAGEVVRVERFAGGHIHASFVVTCAGADSHADTNTDGTRYLLQRINQRVFRNVDAMMANIAAVTEHIRYALARRSDVDPDRGVLTFVPTKAGEPFHRDADGEAWRMYRFIEDSRVYANARTPARAESAAAAFGEFQRILARYDGPRLHETIPEFHNTALRYTALDDALRADCAGRTADVAGEIEFARARREDAGRLIELQQSGAIPERIVHNDAKISNVLFDVETDAALCVVDLDTIMPGLSLYDFGDMVRSMACPAEEDETDLARVMVRPDLFAGLVRGYLATAGEMLTPIELDHLVFAGKLITLEQGVRFLTDYLVGDRYYAVTRATHNLERARNQFALLRSIEEREPELRRIVDETRPESKPRSK